MSRVDMRTVENRSGTVYDADDTDTIFAEDVLAIKEAIDDGSSGVNTEQVEIQGTEAITISGNLLRFGDTSSGNYVEFDTSNNECRIYVNNTKVREWK